MIKSYDFDGVIYSPSYLELMIRPTSNDDVIITGRTYEEAYLVLPWLKNKDIYCNVFFNPISLSENNRELSALHKVNIINKLLKNQFKLIGHYEDDPFQYDILKQKLPDDFPIILVDHGGELMNGY